MRPVLQDDLARRSQRVSVPHPLGQSLDWRWIDADFVNDPIRKSRVARRQARIVIVKVDDDGLSKRAPVIHRFPYLRHNDIALEYQHVTAPDLPSHLRVAPVERGRHEIELRRHRCAARLVLGIDAIGWRKRAPLTPIPFVGSIAIEVYDMKSITSRHWHCFPSYHHIPLIPSGIWFIIWLSRQTVARHDIISLLACGAVC